MAERSGFLALANVQQSEGAFRNFFREPGGAFRIINQKNIRGNLYNEYGKWNICLQDRFPETAKDAAGKKIKLHRMIPRDGS